MRKKTNFGRWIFLFGIFALILAFIMKDLKFGILGSLRPLGFVSVYVCPVVGATGIIVSLFERSLMNAVLNFILVLTFPILMMLGNFI